MEIIKKYTNRKLYSTKLKKYVNISYVVDLVKLENFKFKVISNDTNEDITKDTLLQAVLITNPTRTSLESFIRSNL